MTFEEAKIKLLTHGAVIRNHESWGKGFLGQLKPYRGAVPESVLDEIKECLSCIHDHIKQSSAIDYEIVAGIQGLLHYGRIWLLNEDSGLRRSGRISEDEVKRLEMWLNEISDIYTGILWFK